MTTLQAFDRVFITQNGNLTLKVVQESVQGTLEFAAERQGILHHLLEHLARIRMLQHIGFVAQHIYQTAKNNQQLKRYLVSALLAVSHPPSRAQIDYALAPWFSFEYYPVPGRPLKCKDIGEIKRRLARFNGVGNAQEQSRQLMVNTWPPHNANRCGHMSLTLTTPEDESHFSYWPREKLPYGDPHSYSRLHPANNYFNDTLWAMSESYHLQRTEAKAMHELFQRGDAKALLWERVTEWLNSIARYINLEHAVALHNGINTLKILVFALPILGASYPLNVSQQIRQAFGDCFLKQSRDILCETLLTVVAEQSRAGTLKNHTVGAFVLAKLRADPAFGSRIQSAIEHARHAASAHLTRSREVGDEEKDI